MAWHLTESVDEFWSAAERFLRAKPVEHTLPLSLAATLRTRDPHFYGADDPLFGWYATGAAVQGVCLQTPPRPLIITAAPAGTVAELAGLLAHRPLPGVNALAADADAFAAAWRRLTGASSALETHSRLFRLGTLVPPSPPPAGVARIAQSSDRGLLVTWLTAFNDDLGEPDHDSTKTVDDMLSYGGLTLWEVGGRPVSLAGAMRIESGVARVAPVYTPVELRRNGYAAAATSAVTQAALDAGAVDVVLFTDVANPTSNGVYQRLGYRPVEDRIVLRFTT